MVTDSKMNRQQKQTGCSSNEIKTNTTVRRPWLGFRVRRVCKVPPALQDDCYNSPGLYPKLLFVVADSSSPSISSVCSDTPKRVILEHCLLLRRNGADCPTRFRPLTHSRLCQTGVRSRDSHMKEITSC